jgi:hypothetical protein
VASSLLEVKLQRRLASFASRFAACQDRLQMLQSLHAQQEVQTRNTAAAFEAERRLLTQWTGEEIRRHVQSQDDVDSKPGGMKSAESGGKRKGTTSAGSRDVQIPGTFAVATTETGTSALSITPECEAFLRSVFRQLDPEDTGTVSRRLLLQCLHTAAARGLLRCSHSHPGSHEVGACERRNTGSCRSGNGRSSGVPPSDIWAKLIHGLEGLAESSSSRGESEDMTWGEFLLLLCPLPPRPRLKRGGRGEASREKDPAAWSMLTGDSEEEEGEEEEEGDPYGDVRLSPADHRHLHHSKLLGDLDWAMVPLSLPPAAFEADESALIPTSWLRTVLRGGSNVEFDVSRLKKEALRLARERAFLLRRVQVMCRSLERRATSIRSYFSYDLRKLTLKNDTTQRSLRDSQVYVGELEGRVQSLSADLQQERNQVSVQQELLSAQVEDLQTRLAQASSREETSCLEKVLEEYREKVNQTESELRIVRKELNKAALAHKTLQRDLKRHQATESAAQDLAEDYKAKYKEQKRATAALEEEHEELTARLATSEKALEAINAMQQEKSAAAARKQAEAEAEAEAEADRKEKARSNVVAENSTRGGGGGGGMHSDNTEDSRRHADTSTAGPPAAPLPPSPISYPPSSLHHDLPRDRTQHQQHAQTHDDGDYAAFLSSSYQHQSMGYGFPHAAPGPVLTPKPTPPQGAALMSGQGGPQVASGLALENMARKLRMMAESLND